MSRIKGLTAKILMRILKEQVAKWGDLEIGFDVVVGDSQDAYFWQLDKNSIKQKGNKIYLSSVRIKDNVPIKLLQAKEVTTLNSLDCSLNSIIDRFKDRYDLEEDCLDHLVDMTPSEFLMQVVKDDLEELVKLYLDIKSQVNCSSDYPTLEEIFEKPLKQEQINKEDTSLGALEVHFMKVV